MKKFLPIYFMSFFFVFFSSCSSGQKKSSSPKDNIKEKSITKETNNSSPDHDPFFTESESITKLYGPKSITRNMIQDKKGNYWFATWEGILHYNGITFTNFTNKDSLRRYHVFSLLEDKDDNIWFGTIGAGLYFYDGKTFTNISTDDGLAYNRTGCIYEDKNGNIWIGTERGISFCKGGSISTGNIKFKNYDLPGVANNSDVNSIIEDDEGNIWIGTRGDAFIFDGKKFSAIMNNDGSTFNNVRSIIQATDGNIWLGGNNGLWRYDGDTYYNHTKEFVGYIFEDSQGKIWTSSTVDGSPDNWALTFYEKSMMPVALYNSTLVEPKVGMLFGITEDTKSNIWFGTLKGVGRYDGKSFEYFRE